MDTTEFRRKVEILNSKLDGLLMQHQADQVEKYMWVCTCSPNTKRNMGAMHRHMLIEGVKEGME